MKIPKQVNLAKEIGSEWIRETVPGMEPRIETRPLTDEAEIYRARQLATQCFKELGKIDSREVNEDNVLIHDPFLPYSTYFGAFENEAMRATTRLIWSEASTADDLRLPVDALDPQWRDFLRDQTPGSIGEIGSLSKEKGSSNVTTLKVLRELFGFADDNEVQYLVCGLEPKVVERLYSKLFGGALQPLHNDHIAFPGIEGVQVPYIIDLPRAFSDHRERQATRRTLGERAVGMMVRNYFKSHVTSWQ